MYLQVKHKWFSKREPNVLYLIASQDGVWKNLGLSEGAMSRADFLTYSAYAAVDVAIEINNRNCTQQPDCQMPELEYRQALN